MMKTDPSVHRCAVYFAPAPDSPWWRAGSQWLGRCAQSGLALDQPAVAGVAPELMRQLTAAPRRYGWHATLKAPFALASGLTLDDARLALRALSRQLQPFTLPALEVTRLDQFLALTPSCECPQLGSTAQRCVTQLHPLAAPLDAAEMQRRRGSGLTPRQELLLQGWGYPWVFECFEFHMSLTGDLGGVPAATQLALADGAAAHFSALPAFEFSGLSLFVEPSRNSDFVLVEFLQLGA